MTRCIAASISLQRNSVFNYNKLIKEFPDIEFAPKYEDDNDESIEGEHK